jgi:hypothetical protein
MILINKYIHNSTMKNMKVFIRRRGCSRTRRFESWLTDFSGTPTAAKKDMPHK